MNLARSHLLLDDWASAADAVAVDSDDLGDPVATLLIAPAVRARGRAPVGHLHQALAEVGRSLNAAMALGTPRHFGTLDALIARTGVLTERNDLADAMATIAQMHTLMERHRDSPAYDVLTRVDQVRVAVALAGLDDGFAVLDEARAYLGDREIPLLRRITDEVEARWRIESGELRRADELLDGLPPACPTTCAPRSPARVGPRPSGRSGRTPHPGAIDTLRDRLAANILIALACVERHQR